MGSCEENLDVDNEGVHKILPVHKITFSFAKYFTVCATLLKQASDRNGGSANTTSNE